VFAVFYERNKGVQLAIEFQGLFANGAFFAKMATSCKGNHDK